MLRRISLICCMLISLASLAAAQKTDTGAGKTAPSVPAVNAVAKALTFNEATIYVTDGKQKFSRSTFSYQVVSVNGCVLKYNALRSFSSEEGPGNGIYPVELDLAKLDASSVVAFVVSEATPPPEGMKYSMDGWGWKLEVEGLKPVPQVIFPSKRNADAFHAKFMAAIAACHGGN